MKEGARRLIRLWMLLLIIITLLNITLVIIEHPQEGNVVYAAAAVAARHEVATGSVLPKKQQILALLQKANSWQMAHPVMKPEDRNWERATWYTGVMAAWKATQDRSFLDQALAWGRQHEWKVGTEPAGANRLFCVETWTELYLVKKDRAMIEPAVKWLATPDPISPAGSKHWYLDPYGDSHDKEHELVYVDALYGASALAMLAKATGDQKYIDIMNAFFDDISGQLLDKESGLYYRDPRFIGQSTANGKKILWSRGNGWVFAGIARVLEYLPKNHPSRQHYLEIFRRQASELIKRQGADGLWRVNLDDPDQFPNPETSGTGFFCFGLAWGINHGVLNRKEYLPAVEKAWAGLTQSLSPEGKILWGQPVDDRPHLVTSESTHEYVTGTFLLSGSEIYKLAH
ncbi:MAG: glycoside hydrolase family 105 protein [Terriglobia bacterium]